MRTNQVISIVDDDEAVRVATESFVRSLGWPTRVFASAEEFLQSAAVGKTACLISDVKMPGMSGVEMHEHLQNLGLAPPTIFVTAFLTAPLRAKILANGALAIFEKPLDAGALAQRLAYAVGKP